jgi:acyl transferase domain-containing protein
VQAIWSEILGHDGFGIEDSFFNIGGDSVRIVRMQGALERQLHRPVPVPKLFEHITIKALTAYLTSFGSKDPHNQESRMVRRGPNSTNEDIAIISMACRLPGAVATPEDFWQVLQSGGNTTTDVPKDRWDADKPYHADPGVDGTSYCRRGGFLDSINSYDASFFGISPREARAMDPEQHLMLELCWEAFERAGYTRDQLNGSATGIFLGVSKNRATSYGLPTDLKGHSITGSAEATLSGRLSYTFNLHGPSLTVDTACSSSLVATYLACNALRQGECDMAMVGGVSLLLTPGIHIEFSKLRGLSVDGRCRAFSDDADGTGFSEGATTVILKRVSDAQRDGDDIHAVLRGTAVMHGGHSVSLTAPSGPRQEAVIRTALAQSALEPGSIDYIEAHGTATKLGDPIEATALTEVFGTGHPRSDPLRFGSAKSNVGHTQATAGLVGLLKVVLSMKNNMLPKTLHVREPARAIDWKSTDLELVLNNRSWLPNNNRLRRAGVSAFGIGETIAHVIVEEFHGSVEKTGDTVQPVLLAAVLSVLSGNSESALRAQAGKLRSHIESGNGKSHRLADVAYSLATSRTHFHQRLAIAAGDKQQMLKQLESISSGHGELLNPNEAGKASLGMLFTGQGSQRVGMGKDLYSIFPVFRDALDDAAAQFTELEYPLLDVMWPEPGSSTASLLNRTDYAQPALLALEVSLWRLWQSRGVQAAFLLGHSVGELAVAHVSGILNLRDACRLVLMRGRLMQAIARHGKTIAIETSSGEVVAAIKEFNLSDKVQVAGYNTPSQTVLSGDFAAVEAIEAHFAALGAKGKVLDTSHAFHSHHMDDMLDDFKAVAQTLQFCPPTIPIISSMTGRLANEGELEQAEYWTKQARNAVRFCDAFQSLFNEGANIFLEIGPSPTLCGLGAACLADAPQARSALWLPSLKPNTDGCSVIQDSIGKLHVRKVLVDWSAFFEPFGCRRVDLPTYAFQREVGQPAKQSSGLDRSLQNAGADKPAQDARSMMFEINWRRVESHKVQPHGSWGLLCPSEETAWTKDAKKALLSTGIQLVSVTKLQEAERLDGLLSLWDSNADVVHSAHDFTRKALSQL